MTSIALAPSRLRELDELLATEYLVPNGLAGYTMGTAAGARTRQYHGFLVAALVPPVVRTLLVAQVDIAAQVDADSYPLATHIYGNGIVDPDGYRRATAFALVDGLPQWTHALGEGRSLTETHWLIHGENTAVLRAAYDAPPDAPPATIRFTPLCSQRDHHRRTRSNEAGWRWQTAQDGPVIAVTAREGTPPYFLAAYGADGATGNFTPEGTWYYNFQLAAEDVRGFGGGEDAYQVGQFHVTLQPGECAHFVAAVVREQANWGSLSGALERETARRQIVMARRGDAPADEVTAQLRLAADAFLVRRGFTAEAGTTVVAGYPWFTDWGRDSMIALPGLCLTTGRAADAAGILRTFAASVSEGMLPNRFPDSGETAEYNTIDATLWFFRAIERYVDATGDRALLRDLWPALVEIIAWHQRGTRYAIHVDPTDGLLSGGEPGVQLTWMDAKVGDWVVTPRIGKPVEINGLWYHALRLMTDWAPAQGADAAPYAAVAAAAAAGFVRRFWDMERGYLCDVVDTPSGDDTALRPNQCIALMLPTCPLPDADARTALAAVTAQLLTPYGLRTLAPTDAQYIGRYAGGPLERDGAYHQGTVWPWLLGPYVDAFLRLGGTRMQARALLGPLVDTLRMAGIGSLSEVCDGDTPHAPGGCPMQAWSVAELLRLWLATTAPDVARRAVTT
ncbi:MAG: amylo-alpha-1,6-glucosidase [Thermomicrobiales bacterium]